ncbi:MAG: uroporphyrinogen decarboxylase family protein [Chloroflexota bacterium]|jgi:hypothetical protein|nr:uroporphyrinogen decarboxylase family protein [Chloroflexota bacterium]MDP6757142.1 uroporphyrinogen decarboxylase family protein [Chloroflexota bacterium]
MNSRERVQRAINHREPDRVPIDLGASRPTGIHSEVYARLRKALGFKPGPVGVFDLFQMLGEVEMDVVSKLGIDTLPVTPLKGTFSFNLPQDRRQPYRFWWMPEDEPTLVPAGFDPVVEPDGSLTITDSAAHPDHNLGQMPPEGWYFDRLGFTGMSDDLQLEDIAGLKAGMGRLTDTELDFVRDQAEALHTTTDKALVGEFMGGRLGETRGMTFPDWMIALATEREYMYNFYQASAEVAIENLEMYRDAVGDRIDVVVISTADYGTQRGEMFSLEVFQELFVPAFKRVNDWVHANTAWKTYYHSCGSVRHLIEPFIGSGVDILNPTQTSAANMDPSELQRDFGGRIVFWGGGIDTQRVLPFGTVDEVRDQVRQRIQTFGPDGGFVFSTVHNIQAKVPTENILAMYDAVHEFGRYPLKAYSQPAPLKEIPA